MESLQDEVKAALRSTDRLKLRASSDRCGISTTTKTSTAQLRRNLQQWLEDVDGLVLPPRCSAVILRRAFTTVLCSSVALVCARRDYAVISVGTLSTSILYWRKASGREYKERTLREELKIQLPLDSVKK